MSKYVKMTTIAKQNFIIIIIVEEQEDKYYAECISNENCDNLFKCLKGELKFKTEGEIEKEKRRRKIKTINRRY